jgi:hypothetical protein
VDGRTREARQKKQKANSSSITPTMHSSKICPSGGDSETRHDSPDKDAQLDDVIRSWEGLPQALLDQATPFDDGFKLDFTSHEASLPSDASEIIIENPSRTPDDSHLQPHLDEEGHPSIHPRAVDFAVLVQGIELSLNAPVIHWPGGFTTCVPFVAREDNASENILVLVGLSSFIFI